MLFIMLAYLMQAYSCVSYSVPLKKDQAAKRDALAKALYMKMFDHFVGSFSHLPHWPVLDITGFGTLCVTTWSFSYVFVL